MSFTLAVPMRPCTAAVGVREEPDLPSERGPAKCPHVGVVGHTDATVAEETDETVAALQHAIHRLACAEWVCSTILSA